MSEYKTKIIELIESNITGYQTIKTGVSQYVISQLRQGKREVDNLTLNTTEKLYKYSKNVIIKLINNNIRIAELDSEENTFKHYK